MTRSVHHPLQQPRLNPTMPLYTTTVVLCLRTQAQGWDSLSRGGVQRRRVGKRHLGLWSIRYVPQLLTDSLITFFSLSRRFGKSILRHTTLPSPIPQRKISHMTTSPMGRKNYSRRRYCHFRWIPLARWSLGSLRMTMPSSIYGISSTIQSCRSIASKMATLITNPFSSWEPSYVLGRQCIRLTNNLPIYRSSVQYRRGFTNLLKPPKKPLLPSMHGKG